MTNGQARGAPEGAQGAPEDPERMKDTEPPWSVESGPFGPVVVLHGPWTPEARDCVRSMTDVGLCLNYAKGWVTESYDFLEEVPHLNSLDLIEFKVEDLRPVGGLRELRALNYQTYSRAPIDFSSMAKLERCCMYWSAERDSIRRATALKWLTLVHYPYPSLAELEELRQLEDLTLADTSLQSLQGLAALRNLTRLEVDHARRLADISQVASRSSLRVLWLNTCRKISTFEPIGCLTELQELWLCNDGPIPNLSFLRGLLRLHTFLFYQSTNIVDGDLSPLLSLPELKSIAFQERKHYTHKGIDFERLGIR